MTRRRQLATLAVTSGAIAIVAVFDVALVASASVVPGIAVFGLAVVVALVCVWQLSPNPRRSLALTVASALCGAGSLGVNAVRLHESNTAPQRPSLREPISDVTAPEHAVGYVDDLRPGPADPDSTVGTDFTCRRHDGVVVVVGFFPSAAASHRRAARTHRAAVYNADGTIAEWSTDPGFTTDVRASGGLPD